jgi:hypothetical protein
MAAFINPAQVIEDGAGAVTVSFPPVYTLFLPVMLNRTPTRDDQATLADALTIIEASYPASPSGLLIFSVSYGLPYFSRLPQALVNSVMPTLLADPGRSVLEEAVPFATDVTGGLVGGPGALIPNVTKDRFNVNVQIESNDMLFHFRSDSLVNLERRGLVAAGQQQPRRPPRALTRLQRALQLPGPAYPVRAARTAAQDGRRTGLRVRAQDQSQFLDGHGLRRPAGQRQRAARDRHLHGQHVGPADQRGAGRLLRQRLRPPTSSPRCAPRQRHSSSSSSSWAARATTMAWSGSSPRPGGRTSWSRRAGTGPSRCWSSPEAGFPRPRPAQCGGTCHRDERMTAPVSLKYFMAEWGRRRIIRLARGNLPLLHESVTTPGQEGFRAAEAIVADLQ